MKLKTEHYRASVAAVVISLLHVASLAPSLAQTPASRPSPNFEIQLGGGGLHTPFSTIGPWGQTSRGTTPAPRDIVSASQTGTLRVIDGHAIFRPAQPGLFGVDGYRLDFSYRSGEANQSDSFDNMTSTANVYFSSVDAVAANGAGTGATRVRIDSQISQYTNALALKPSLVWERNLGWSQAMFRLGGGYTSMHQRESIYSLATAIAVGTKDFDVQNLGQLTTHAAGVVTAVDLRIPVATSFFLLAGLEGTLDLGRTTYAGETLKGGSATALKSVATATDRSNHLMTGLRATIGAEWMPLPGLLIGVSGDAGWQNGLAKIVTPQSAYDNAGNPNYVFAGPAHIEYEDRVSYGLRGAVRLQF